MRILFLLLISLFTGVVVNSQSVYKSTKGTIKFTSDAPLEVIKASSDKLSGALKTSDRSFAFLVPMKSFEGFNSALQRTHFNENYMESDLYANATFEGKIIEDIDLLAEGKYEVRGKGKFTVHGVEQVRIIKCTLVISAKGITISSNFTVLMEDHNIKIPSIVNQKIAKEISVEINTTLAKVK